MAPIGRRYRDSADKNPFSFYDAIRQRAPVYWDDSVNGWLITDHENCTFVLRREDLFSRADRELPGGKALRGDTRDVSLLSGKDHDKLHSFLIGLTARWITEAYRKTVIRSIADELIDRFIQRGCANLAVEFADQLPIRVGIDIVGMDPQNETLVERVRSLKLGFDHWRETMGEEAEDAERAAQFGAEMKNVVMPVVRERKAHPREDLISAIWEQGSTVFEDWNEEDTFAACRPYLSGGETQYALRNLIYLLLVNPALRERVATDPEVLVSRFIEEALRVVGVVHWQIRIATEDVHVGGGVEIKQGDRVFPMYAAANRDPNRYSSPSEIDLTTDTRQNHLAFGIGPRYCTGAALARAQAHEAICALLERLTDLRLDDTAEPPALVGYHIRSFAPLWACFDS